MATRKRYVRPHRYTAAELLAAEIADLEVDIRCAQRDGLHEYEVECRTKLADLRLAGSS